MNAITIQKSKLIAILKKNREKHRTIFLEAQKGYGDAVVAKLVERLEDARNGKRILPSFSFIEPMDQTKEYDRALAMLELADDVTILLEEHDFRSYVQDEWSWKGQFNASNRAYSKSLDDILSSSDNS